MIAFGNNPVIRTEEVLIVARTYPTPSQSDIEVSCTAGVTRAGDWIRLFPVPYRFLNADKRFHKYQEISVQIAPANDGRPESNKIYDINSIEILRSVPPKKYWEERAERVEHLRRHCMCCILDQRAKGSGPTLGFFRPHRITRLAIRPASAIWTDKQRGKLEQVSFLENTPLQQLEKIPFSFKYHFKCPHRECRGHKMSCTDWEMAESYRRWRAKYGDGWEPKFRQRYEQDMIERFDTHFFVGTVHRHPLNWIIVGLWHPLKMRDGLIRRPKLL